MKNLRTNIDVIVDVTEPTRKAKVLFRDFVKTLRVELGDFVINFNSYEVVPAIPKVIGTGTASSPQTPAIPETYILIKSHIKVIPTVEGNLPTSLSDLDTITQSLTLSSTTTIEKEIEELLETAKILIEQAGFYGLANTNLIIE